MAPFRPDVDDLGLAFIQDLDHGWEGTHQAFNEGRYDQWIPAKSSTTMAHLRRHDVPFHYALADAFTICDSYHCSLLGPTDPNRYYMWTGWVGNDGKGGGPVIGNDELGYDWTTYPERLEAAGVSWKIYQDMGVGLDQAGYWGYTDDAYIGNYGDNSLLYFDNYRNAQPGDPLYEKARTGTDASAGEGFFDRLEADVRADTLPQISWIVAPEAFTEHPNWPANYGAWYVARALDALTSNPDVWSKTAVFLTFDENDGFFDHLVPPYPNSTRRDGDSTVAVRHERYTGSAATAGNYGLGQRVPMTVISPWSTGGWVCSETFDHTSIIRFMEARFGVHEPNITPWRRAVCGDLTSAFDFGATSTEVPRLPATASYAPTDDQRHPDYVPVPPAYQHVPAQEPGVRPSRALGYELAVTCEVSPTALRFELDNHGSLGAHLQARSASDAPRSYTVGASHSLATELAASGSYDVSFHGPNGFFRRFAGDTHSSPLEVELRHERGGSVLRLVNRGAREVYVRIEDAYSRDDRTRRISIAPHRHEHVRIRDAGGWYDLAVRLEHHETFLRWLAGRVETGHAGISDPQLGR